MILEEVEKLDRESLEAIILCNGALYQKVNERKFLLGEYAIEELQKLIVEG